MNPQVFSARQRSAPRRWSGLAAVLLLLPLLCSCDKRDSPELWPEWVRSSIQKVSADELLARLRAAAARQREMGLPTYRAATWNDRQAMANLVTHLLDVTPGDFADTRSRLSSVGLMGDWFEVQRPKNFDGELLVGAIPREYVLWIREPADSNRGLGMYLVRYPNVSPVAVGVPAGFDGSGLAERALELFVRTDLVGTMGLDTMREPTGAEEPGAQPRTLYVAWAMRWLDSVASLLWVDLVSFSSDVERVAGPETATSLIWTSQEDRKLTGRLENLLAGLIEAKLIVERASRRPDLGLAPSSASRAVMRRARSQSRPYALLAFSPGVVQMEGFLRTVAAGLREARLPVGPNELEQTVDLGG